MKRLARWGYLHAGQIALVVASTAMALTFWSYSGTLRAACEDRNQRDARVLLAFEGIADAVDAPPRLLVDLRRAMSPADCAARYPRFSPPAWPG